MGLVPLQGRFRFIWVWYPYRIGFVSYGFGTPTGSVSFHMGFGTPTGSVSFHMGLTLHDGFHMGLVPPQDRFRFIWVWYTLQDRFRFIWVWYPYRIGSVSYGFGTPTGSVSFHMGMVPLQDRLCFTPYMIGFVSFPL